ncbi:hypothetical protein ACOME3_004137 [Neoechinorhynchus agilis]
MKSVIQKSLINSRQFLRLLSTNSSSKSYNEAVNLISSQSYPNDEFNYYNSVAVGEELVGPLDRTRVLKVLSDFYRLPEIRSLAKENGLDLKMFQEAYSSFKRMCLAGVGQSSLKRNLPPDLHITLHDIIVSQGNKGTAHVADIAPYFLKHAQTAFPHLMCIEDLKKISDLREPPNWYCEARAISRKFVYHAGPTNSGKTYQAIQRFLSASSGVYCGPLKLLATEIAVKSCIWFLIEIFVIDL